jgi:hypothetical protein
MKDIKNNIWIPTVGEGIFVLETNEWFIIRQILTMKSWSIYVPSSDDELDDVVGVEVINKNGRKIKYRLDEIRKETFCEYLKRPTGVGRMSWTKVVILSSMMIFGHTLSIMTWNDNGWVGSILLLGILFGWLYATWRNYKNINQ